MNNKLINEVVNKLISKKITISTCESATAGLVASSICDISGASNIFFEGYITYSNESKIKILNVDKNIIEKFGVVSKEVSIEMANNLHLITNADICISVTGNLGPNALDNKKIGLVYICINYNNNNLVYECNFNGDRIDIKKQVVNQCFLLLNDLIK